MVNKNEINSLIKKALKEMEQKQVVLLIRGDLVHREDLPLYKEMYNALKDVQVRLKENKDLEKTIGDMNTNIFMKHESFFMDLFDTNEFPWLFNLFEYE